MRQKDPKHPQIVARRPGIEPKSSIAGLMVVFLKLPLALIVLQES